MGNRRAVFDLFLASLLGLFVELVFIRWVSSELRVIAFYKNFALIAAFLGLGIGFAIQRRKETVSWFERIYFPLMAVIVVVVLVLGRTQLDEMIMLNRASAQEYVWTGSLASDNPWVMVLFDVVFYIILLSLFVLLTVLFIPLGQLTASKFSFFRPLPGYTINVVGSLAGILLYTLVSFLEWPPAIWFLLSGLVALYFLPRANWRRAVGCCLLAAVPVVLVLVWPTGADWTFWSPYYRIDVQTKRAQADPAVDLGYDLSVNLAWHQELLNLAPDFVGDNYSTAPEHFDTMLTEYDTPYEIALRLDRVLIVGAGTGNDVAGALRAGAKQVVAVEIDPLILRLGKELHPEAPYGNPAQVTLVNQDARSFIRRDREKYDLIVFGLLDSHTLFSAASSVRLDNFVYTHESLTEVRDLLADDGLLVLTFSVSPEHEWVGLRLYRILADAFGHPPQVYSLPSSHVLFLTACDPLPEVIIDDPNIQLRSDYGYRKNVAPATDDWPFLYLRHRTVPLTYLVMLSGVLVLGVLFVRRALPNFRQINRHFFFMGAAFFLLETKSITEMALLLGSTWIVNAAVIAAILTMIVIANILVRRFHLTDVRPFYGLLVLVLLFNFFVPIGHFLGLGLAWSVILASLAQAAPLFFAGVIFAITFSQTDSIEVALGSNMIGSVLGGVLEYASLALGIRSLYLFALVLYVLSALALSGFSRRWLKDAIPNVGCD
jgi:hypothetical protein